MNPGADVGVVVSTNVDAVIARLNDRMLKQVPYAMSYALNLTAKDVQDAVRRKLTSTVTIRTAQSGAWLSRLVKINRGTWASKDKLAPVRVGIGKGFSADDARTVLPLVEFGGVRFSRMQIGSGQLFPAGSVAIPIRQGAFAQGPVPRYLYPSALGLQDIRDASGELYRAARGRKSRRKTASQSPMKGSARTFAVRTRAGQGLILQRMGPTIVRALFTIKPQVRVPARHFFGPTALATAKDRFDPNFQLALGRALRTAR